MKQANLRAAAHNIADSISGELSFALGVYHLPVWDAVDASSTGEITIDLLRGTVTPAACDEQLCEGIKRASHELPAFLEKHSCDAEHVSKLEIRLRRPDHRETPSAYQEREVFVTVAQKDGAETIDRYLGLPLKRVVRLDPLGRRRRDRGHSG